MAILMSDVLADPMACAAHLVSGPCSSIVIDATGKAVHGHAIVEAKVRAPAALYSEGYPDERLRFVVAPDGDAWTFILSGRDRQFDHRQVETPRTLCLFYPDDPPALRWIPEDGFEPLVTIAARHVVYEEAARRNGMWPVEDAPHGRPTGHPHPIRDERTRQLARRWARR
jgi:hypothetical protein